MGEKLKDLSRKQILEKLSLEQLKNLANDWWGLKSPYKTKILGKKLRSKKDFISFFMTKGYFKKDLIKNIKKQAKVPVSQRRRLERLVNHKCEGCKEPLPSTPDVHHIIPISEGGSNVDNNLIVLCPNCHRKAHSGTYTEKKLKSFIKKRKKR